MRLVERIALLSVRTAIVGGYVLLVGAAQPQSTATVMVHVYRDHFEVAGQRVESVDDLRELTRDRAIGISIRECGADNKEREVLALIQERAGKRPYNLLYERYPLECEGGH
jgi:hypothetical protein